MAVDRQVKEGRQRQGVDEEVYWKIDTTPWGGTPTSTSAAAYDVTGGIRTLVTTTVLSGSTSVSGDDITLPKLSALTEGHVYRVEVKMTISSNVFEAWFEVEAEA
ncbi:MAG TPA: hypothetical protein DCP69_04275 [Candidatus Omnitrophica bacterium]|nr:hypothetical protein [Candidatus Omnitrophota bacterium]